MQCIDYLYLSLAIVLIPRELGVGVLGYKMGQKEREPRFPEKSKKVKQWEIT